MDELILQPGLGNKWDKLNASIPIKPIVNKYKKKKKVFTLIKKICSPVKSVTKYDILIPPPTIVGKDFYTPISKQIEGYQQHYLGKYEQKISYL
jgi:hypothetical protein